MTETADRKLGKRRRIKKPWITKEVLNECDKRRELKSKRNLGEEHMAQYRDANRKTHQALAKARNEWIERQAAEIEDSLHRNNSKKAYEVVKQLTFCSKHNRTSCIEDQGGKLLTKGSEIAERWKNYCSELYNHAAVVDRDILKEDVKTKEEDEELEILESEVRKAIKQLKEQKAPGADNISAELITNGGEKMIKILHTLCNNIFKSKKWPSQ